MNRFRLAAWATVVGLGLVSGCSTFGNGGYSSGNGFFSRLFHRNNACCDVGCPCDMGSGSGFGGGLGGSFGGCCGPGCSGGGPMVMDPWSGGAPPGAYPPGAVGGPVPGSPVPQSGVPPLATPPQFTAPPPQAQPLPAGPVSRAK